MFLRVGVPFFWIANGCVRCAPPVVCGVCSARCVVIVCCMCLCCLRVLSPACDCVRLCLCDCLVMVFVLYVCWVHVCWLSQCLTCLCVVCVWWLVCVYVIYLFVCVLLCRWHMRRNVYVALTVLCYMLYLVLFSFVGVAFLLRLWDLWYCCF